MKASVLVVLLSAVLVSAQSRLTVFYTNNINGALDNCICPEHPLGSVEKMKVIIDGYRQNKTSMLLVDGGDFLSAFGNASRDSLAFRAASLMKFDAMGIGDQEFVHGSAYFLWEIRDKNLPYLSQNLHHRDAPPWKPFKRLKSGNIQILITAVTAETAFEYLEKEKLNGLQIRKADEAISDFVGEMKPANELFILLSHGGLDFDKELAAEFQDVDIIIGAHSQDIIKTPLKIGNTLIVQSGSEGYYLGKLDIEVSKEGKIISADNQLLPMHIDLPNDSMIVDLLRSYYTPRIRELIRKNKQLSPVLIEYSAAPANACSTCHTQEYAQWKKSPHFNSWTTLEEEKKTHDSDCFLCHVNGYGHSEGFINVNLTKEQANVGCTSCHYMDAGHLKIPRNFKPLKISEETCRRCHDSVNDAEFNFSADTPKIKHTTLLGKKSTGGVK